jgi:endonuclease YncB( thermonuclease family)
LAKILGALVLAALLADGCRLEEGRPGAGPPGRNEAGEARLDGRVLRVSDGDSLIVAARNGRRLTVRLYGVDAPELGQDHGRASRDYLAALLSGKAVALERHGRDQYGRLLARVYLDGRALDEALVRDGQAWVYSQYCQEIWCAKRLAEQREARRQRLGLWRTPRPTPPWVWRRERSGRR